MVTRTGTAQAGTAQAGTAQAGAAVRAGAVRSMTMSRPTRRGGRCGRRRTSRDGTVRLTTARRVRTASRRRWARRRPSARSTRAVRGGVRSRARSWKRRSTGSSGCCGCPGCASGSPRRPTRWSRWPCRASPATAGGPLARHARRHRQVLRRRGHGRPVQPAPGGQPAGHGVDDRRDRAVRRRRQRPVVRGQGPAEHDAAGQPRPAGRAGQHRRHAGGRRAFCGAGDVIAVLADRDGRQ